MLNALPQTQIAQRNINLVEILVVKTSNIPRHTSIQSHPILPSKNFQFMNL